MSNEKMRYEAYQRACKIVGVETHDANQRELLRGVVIKDGDDRYIVNSKQQMKKIKAEGEVIPVPHTLVRVTKTKAGVAKASRRRVGKTSTKTRIRTKGQTN